MKEVSPDPTGPDALPGDRSARPSLLPTAVTGMLIFLTAEVMFFAALISAYLIVSSGSSDWPPPDQPRLPALSTAFNTLALLLSGGMIFHANLTYARSSGSSRRTTRLLLTAILLGSFFVLFQGFEWVRLIKFGLTMKSSTYGSFFYLIIGTHALHAVAALVVLVLVYRNLKRKTLAPENFWAAQVFWYFVVGIWPILYILVYLN
ncbi:MAG: cytochrome c oxidase subunit 3 [Roseibacillus sp.]|jgi:cytochrome c oxidase subunit 3|nr:cytochrome c oxidase subunit 3 [Roseibacillus sp.]MDP7656591.1 cytochrome c oxidase subunit 3 [Roseibacillus sp.]HJM62724.1 cytochrome c oxidase subunit 3 [Roseibacillus sp.]|tara:strand:- start:6294 stop:6908 length:615 start_codon:yes stop_codon:yes gene_type:complete